MPPYTTMRFPALVALLLALVIAAGCSNDGLIPISGEVTFDGSPVENGSISFMPVDGKGVTAGGPIENGRYSARVSPGEMAVSINASREVKKENPTQEEIDRGLDTDTVAYIPAKYNRQSTLKVTVTEAKNDVDFKLDAE